MPREDLRDTVLSLAWRLAALVGILLVLGVMLASERVRYGSSVALLIPVEGVGQHDLVDSFQDPRDDGRLHRGIDIPAPRGTPVVAAAAGRVHRIFSSSRGGLGVYQFDEVEDRCFYYAHLDRYANDLDEGQRLNAGDPIGYVGTTGNARNDVPHLHFTVLRLSETKSCSDGRPINPIALFR